MTITKELNDLIEKMTGTKGDAKTTAEALDYIEQNFTGGGSGNANIIDRTLPVTFLLTYLSDPSKVGTEIEVTDENDIAFINEIFNTINESDKPILRINASGRYLYAILTYSSDDTLASIILRDIMTTEGAGSALIDVKIHHSNEVFYVNPNVYSLN